MKPAAKFALAAILIQLLIAAPMIAQDTSQLPPPPNPGSNPSAAPSDNLPNAPPATQTENKTAGQETKPENKTEPSLQDLGFPPEQTQPDPKTQARGFRLAHLNPV
jgi:hypothetical protein